MNEQQYQELKAKFPRGVFLQDTWSDQAHLYKQYCPTLREYTEFQLFIAIEHHTNSLGVVPTKRELKSLGWTQEYYNTFHAEWIVRAGQQLQAIAKVKDYELEAWVRDNMWTTWWSFENTPEAK